MYQYLKIFAVSTLLMLGVSPAMAIEEAPYTVVTQDGAFELRDYAPHILAQTLVDGTLEEAGSKAFRRLFDYISANNRAGPELSMTAPVSQQAAGERIAMTAPVGQQPVGDSWLVSFMMPASYTLETLPKPGDERIELHQVPARRVAVVRYSGFWDEESYTQYKAELESWIGQQGLSMAGGPVWARYNAPFSLWFLRRNEILIPVGAVD